MQRLKRPQPTDRIKPISSDNATEEFLADLGVSSTTPSRVASRDERVSKLNTLLDTLPDDYRAVVQLYDLEGLPIDDVAGRMNRSAGAVHMLRARAHDRLRMIMGAESQWFTTSA